MKIVLDSDVIISGLISANGAGRFLLKNYLNDELVAIFSSQEQIKEIKEVISRKKFIWHIENDLWQEFCKKVSFVDFSGEFLNQARDYVSDKDDAFILAMAIKAKAEYLLSYNLGHYRIPSIGINCQIIVKSPGDFLQFLRNRDNLMFYFSRG